MNNDNNAVGKDIVPHSQPNEAGQYIVNSLVSGLASVTIGILGEMAAEYNRRQAEEKAQKKAACVELIDNAVLSGERISKQKLVDIIPSLSYCNSRQEMALYLGVSLEYFNTGVKSWYHLF